MIDVNYAAHITSSVSELNSRQALRFPPQQDPSLVRLCMAPCWWLLFSPSPVFIGSQGCLFPSWLVRDSPPAPREQMFLRNEGLCPAEPWHCERSHLEKTATPQEFPRRPHWRHRWADFGPGSGTSGGTAVDDQNVFISFVKKSRGKAGSAAWQNRDLFPPSKLGMENNWVKTQLVFKSNSLKGNELRG